MPFSQTQSGGGFIRVIQQGRGSIQEVDRDDLLIFGEGGEGNDRLEITAEDFIEADHLSERYGDRSDRLELLTHAQTRKGHVLGVEKELEELAHRMPYADSSSGEAVDSLLAIQGTISGDQMARAIQGATCDADDHAASLEYKDLKKFVQENSQRLSPGAKAVFSIYEKSVQEAQQRGLGGIASDDYERMTQEMSQRSAFFRVFDWIFYFFSCPSIRAFTMM